MDKVDLLKLIEDDELDLLNLQDNKSPKPSSDERLIESFDEINEFVDHNGREPIPGNDIQEYLLYARLKGIRESLSKSKYLLDLDKHGLLAKEVKEIRSIQDIFEDDTLGLLNNDEESIFQIKHVPKITTMPSYIASRKICNDFTNYKDKFLKCQSDLSTGSRKLSPFNKGSIERGAFFVLKGVLLYIADVGSREIIGGRTNARLHCIFENGTESDMLLRSLSAELYKDGRIVTPLECEINNLADEDIKSGYIYICKSLSDKQEIKSINDLYKIGYSKISVEERIKKAFLEPTFLMSKVDIIAAFECFNMNPQKLEQLLHRFFGKSCLNIDIFDNEGRRHVPREWFIAPLEIIEQAIHYVLDGAIVRFRYDKEKKMIVNRP